MVLDELLPALMQSLPELGVGGVMFAFAMWRERVHSKDRATLLEERAALIAEATTRWAEDDGRRDRRIAELSEENRALELALDEERARRRAAEDGPKTARLPRRHRLDAAGS